jgi:hypothetical protein
MTAAAGRFSAIAVVVTALAAAAVVLRAAETRYPDSAVPARWLYVRSPDAARRVWLSFDALGADLYWIRAIQHYGRDKKSDRREGRFELLQPLLDLTTTLDPYFSVAYRFGAIFLTLSPPNGPARADQAIELLQKGLRHRPDRWQFAHDIGFVHYFSTHDYAEAARWFQRAADMPDAPPWLRPLAATTSLHGGDLASAEAIYRELAQGQEEFIRQAAARGLAQVRAVRAIGDLQTLVETYHQRAGHYPSSWQDLIAARLLPGVPVDDTGAPFVYNPATRTVALADTSALAPLPAISRR